MSVARDEARTEICCAWRCYKCGGSPLCVELLDAMFTTLIMSSFLPFVSSSVMVAAPAGAGWKNGEVNWLPVAEIV